MLNELFIFIKLFILVFCMMVIVADIWYVVITIILKNGKIIPDTKSLIWFGLALSYIITYFIQLM